MHNLPLRSMAKDKACILFKFDFASPKQFKARLRGPVAKLFFDKSLGDGFMIRNADRWESSKIESNQVAILFVHVLQPNRNVKRQCPGVANHWKGQPWSWCKVFRINPYFSVIPPSQQNGGKNGKFNHEKHGQDNPNPRRPNSKLKEFYAFFTKTACWEYRSKKTLVQTCLVSFKTSRVRAWNASKKLVPRQ